MTVNFPLTLFADESQGARQLANLERAHIVDDGRAVGMSMAILLPAMNILPNSRRLDMLRRSQARYKNALRRRQPRR